MTDACFTSPKKSIVSIWLQTKESKLSVNVDYNSRTITGYPFGDIIDKLEDLYHIGLEKGSARSSIGSYSFRLNGALQATTQWQNVFHTLIGKGIPINLGKSYKGMKRFTLVLSEAIPEESSKVKTKQIFTPQLIIEKEQDHEFSIGKNTQEVAEDRIAESTKSSNKKDETTETGVTGTGHAGFDHKEPRLPVSKDVDELISDIKKSRKDFDSIKWSQLGSPRFSKEQIINLAEEFGISLLGNSKKELISYFDEQVKKLQ